MAEGWWSEVVVTERLWWWLAVVAHGGREGFFSYDEMKKTNQEIVFYKLTLVIRCDMSHLKKLSGATSRT